MTTNTKKKPAKKKATPKQPTVTVTEYGNTFMASPRLSLFGDYLPEDPAEHAEFWKKKYDDQCQKTFTADQKIALLRTIINTALARSCNCDHNG